MKTSPYMNINRIEFLVTLQCTGKCKHCSVGPRLNENSDKCVDLEKAIDAVKKLSARFPVESLMTFGGEPLLYAETTCSIHKIAKQCGIEKRQLITNGYFSKDPQVIREIAKKICQSGINEILLSVDAFHQERIPLETVRLFVEELIRCEFQNVYLQPAWVINSSHQNAYNETTWDILKSFSDLGIAITNGNDIFPAGNAVKYLREFFELPERIDLSAKCGEAPYTDRLDNIRSLSIEPNGDVAICEFKIGNIYESDINNIVNNYDPFTNVMMNALMDGGVNALMLFAKQHGKVIDTSDCYSSCSVCGKILSEFKV